ncbi:MAG: MerR family transcriptional regulator [Gammaproteobacteria bacterium]|nr:MAG: MerR family transcriptional regulator [Gammaproteobacteria bacterium]
MGAGLKMKDLEAATGVGREAIRFYIREGMLPEPERPQRNVAIYRDEHVLRIRAIKRLQSEQFLPLAAIRELMQQADVRALAEGRGPEIAALLPGMLGEPTESRRESLTEVARASGLPRDEIEALAERGLVDILAEEDAAEPTLDARDTAICRIWGRARAAGYVDGDGFDLDHLQRYQDLATWIAGLEVNQFLRGPARRSSDEAAARMGAEGLLLANELIGVLHLRAALRALAEQRPVSARDSAD